MSHRKSIWTVKVVESVPERLLGNSKRIEQILINLIENAILHSFDGGKLKVKSHYCEEVQVLEFRISNFCKKLDPRHVVKMFTMFHRANPITS
jgi:signal transduction histidine kinase